MAVAQFNDRVDMKTGIEYNESLETFTRKPAKLEAKMGDEVLGF